MIFLPRVCAVARQTATAEKFIYYVVQCYKATQEYSKSYLTIRQNVIQSAQREDVRRGNIFLFDIKIFFLLNIYIDLYDIIYSPSKNPQKIKERF